MITAGTLQIGNGGTKGRITGEVTDNGTLVFDRSDSVTIGGVVSGTGSPCAIREWHADFDRGNSYTGATTSAREHCSSETAERTEALTALL